MTPARAVRPANPSFSAAATRLGGVAAAGARTAVAAAIAIAFVRATPDPGPLALATWSAQTVAAHEIPFGAASLGWLGALVASSVAALGPHALALASAACALGALGLVERRARANGAGAVAAMLGTALAALCLLDALRPGADVAAWCLAAFALLLLDAPTRRTGVAFVVTTILWCNLEPAGLLAPLFALASAAGAALDTSDVRAALRSADVRARALVVAGSAVATCCTPAGLGFANAARDALRLGDVRGIAAVVPAVAAPHAYHVGLFALLVVAFFGGVRGRGLRDAVPIVVAFVLALANGAFVPIFGIVAAPAIAASLRGRMLPAFAAPAAALVVVAAIIAGMRANAPADRGPYTLAERAARDIASSDGGAVGAAAERTRRAAGTLFCANVAWCDVATARGARVVMDGRIAPFDDEARDAQRKIAAAGRGFPRALATSGAAAVVAADDTPLATLLALTPGWRLAAHDGGATLFERRSP